MSAYDNPTIIKNDAALIWGQAAGDFAESFTQSYAAAKKDREAKEKEAKLDAEKKAKEAKEQILANQVFLSKSQYNEQVLAEKVGAGLVKLGADASAVDLYNKFKISTGVVEGENNLSINTVVQSREDLDKKAAYSSQRATGEQNLINVTGGMFSQADAIKSGKINATNIGKIRFNGDNLLTQAINRSTTMSNAFFDFEKTTRDLVYDAKGDPSKITLLINNKIGTKEDVFKFFEATNPGVTKDINGKRNDAFLEAEFQRGIKDENIIESKDTKGQYEFKFKKEIDKNWDGTLYSEIPEIEYGKSAITAGVYSKEGDTQINNKFLGKFTYEQIAGNAGVNKKRGSIMFERQEVDMDRILLEMKPTIVAQAEGLIAGPLSDNNVADGVLAQLGYGTNYPSKAFADLTTEQKVTALVAKLEEQEKQNIIAKSGLEPIKDAKNKERYYIQNEKENQIFSNETSGTTTDAQREAASIAAQTKSIKALVDDDTYMDIIESPDGNKSIRYEEGVGWIAENKSGGDWKKDKRFTGEHDKKRLAKLFLKL